MPRRAYFERGLMFCVSWRIRWERIIVIGIPYYDLFISLSFMGSERTWHDMMWSGVIAVLCCGQWMNEINPVKKSSAQSILSSSCHERTDGHVKTWEGIDSNESIVSYCIWTREMEYKWFLFFFLPFVLENVLFMAICLFFSFLSLKV